MATVPYIPETAPFSPDQRAWLNGFVAGLLSRKEVEPVEEGAGTPVLILFGSQSGTAESLAKKLNKEALAQGMASRVCGMDEVEVDALTKEENLLVITSTWGEGEMPDNAAGFWDHLNQNGSSPELNQLNYSVLALGDVNYTDTFCLAGKQLDSRFEELGANRLHPRVDCDVEYEEPAALWTEGVFKALTNGNSGGLTSVKEISATKNAAADPGTGQIVNSRKNPFPASIIANVELAAKSSGKDTRHFEFSLEGSTLEYEAGDALAVFGKNCPDVVDEVIKNHQLDPREEVTIPSGEKCPLWEALLGHFEIRQLVGIAVKAESAEAFVSNLRKLQPRLYSIASSPLAHPGEVHLCVDVVRYEIEDRVHKGVVSTFLAERMAPGDRVDVFVQPTKGFRPPARGDAPMIMVGPGTGIAPFRAFLEHREATEANGPNWLFFGARNRATDFFYQEELARWLEKGLLSRLDLAFSRDQAEKIYVQHLMVQNADQLWSWLEDGAGFYVCGDASRMAKDVDQALHQVIEKAGGKSQEEAVDYVKGMKKDKRYCRDVY